MHVIATAESQSLVSVRAQRPPCSKPLFANIPTDLEHAHLFVNLFISCVESDNEPPYIVMRSGSAGE